MIGEKVDETESKENSDKNQSEDERNNKINISKNDTIINTTKENEDTN